MHLLRTFNYFSSTEVKIWWMWGSCFFILLLILSYVSFHDDDGKFCVSRSYVTSRLKNLMMSNLTILPKKIIQMSMMNFMSFKSLLTFIQHNLMVCIWHDQSIWFIFQFDHSLGGSVSSFGWVLVINILPWKTWNDFFVQPRYECSLVLLVWVYS